MAFTSIDLSNIEAAIVALATGTRVVQVAIGDKSIRYTEAELDKLQSLRSLIQQELGMAYTRTYAKQGGRAS